MGSGLLTCIPTRSLPLCLKCTVLPVAYRALGALNAITPDGSLVAPPVAP